MPIITRLKAGQRDPTRVNLYLDDQFAFSLSAEVVISQSLKVGLNLTTLELTTLRSMGEEERLLAKILNFLSYRPRSRREVEDRLKKYLYKQDNQVTTIASILERLEKLNYIDVLEFATWFVESRMNHSPRSTRLLTSELIQKGIDRSTISQVLASFANNSQALTTLINKKSHLQEDKLISHLARRGFSYSEIKDALSKQAE